MARRTTGDFLPEPQSTAFFVLMMVVFGALMCWLVLAKHLVFRVLAACLAFVPAALFGIAAVNKYYDYYPTWSAAFGDINNQGPQGPYVGVTHRHVPGDFTNLLGNSIYTKLAAQQGYTLQLSVHGPNSHLTRNVYVYLPPQYFQPAYRGYRFPVIELLHGFPGEPQDWITVIGVTATLTDLIRRHLARPAVMVMPDANGARGVSLQCLNQVGGPQDATFLAQDLPSYISRVLRVWPAGRTWGIAGYSEGGFCAANLGLQYGYKYGFAGVLSGYFQPSENQLGHPSRLVNPFGRSKWLLKHNTPSQELLNLPLGAPIPQFWIGSGSGSRSDVRAAQIFRQLVELRQPGVVLRITPGGGHTMATWRQLVPSMLEWMTPKLAANVALAKARATRLAHQRVKKHAPRPPKGQPAPGATPFRPSPRPRHTRH
jgi:enterochelin esterase-like enzyme